LVVPHVVPVTNRRDLLAAGVALAALGVVGSACGKSGPKTPPVEDLLGPLDEARQDSALAAAAAAAPTTAPQVAAALMVVSGQRGAHARALSAEITRATGKITASPSTTEAAAKSSPVESPEPPPPPPPPISDVIDALHASAGNASRMAGAMSGYRAGLLASIAASCTASATVALVTGGASI